MQLNDRKSSTLLRVIEYLLSKIVQYTVAIRMLTMTKATQKKSPKVGQDINQKMNNNYISLKNAMYSFQCEV